MSLLFDSRKPGFRFLAPHSVLPQIQFSVFVCLQFTYLSHLTRPRKHFILQGSISMTPVGLYFLSLTCTLRTGFQKKGIFKITLILLMIKTFPWFSATYVRLNLNISTRPPVQNGLFLDAQVLLLQKHASCYWSLPIYFLLP